MKPVSQDGFHGNGLCERAPVIGALFVEWGSGE